MVLAGMLVPGGSRVPTRAGQRDSDYVEVLGWVTLGHLARHSLA